MDELMMFLTLAGWICVSIQFIHIVKLSRTTKKQARDITDLMIANSNLRNKK